MSATRTSAEPLKKSGSAQPSARISTRPLPPTRPVRTATQPSPPRRVKPARLPPPADIEARTVAAPANPTRVGDVCSCSKLATSALLIATLVMASLTYSTVVGNDGSSQAPVSVSPPLAPPPPSSSSSASIAPPPPPSPLPPPPSPSPPLWPPCNKTEFTAKISHANSYTCSSLPAINLCTNFYAGDTDHKYECTYANTFLDLLTGNCTNGNPCVAPPPPPPCTGDNSTQLCTSQLYYQNNFNVYDTSSCGHHCGANGCVQCSNPNPLPEKQISGNDWTQSGMCQSGSACVSSPPPGS